MTPHGWAKIKTVQSQVSNGVYGLPSPRPTVDLGLMQPRGPEYQKTTRKIVTKSKTPPKKAVLVGLRCCSDFLFFYYSLLKPLVKSGT